jgi:hypothetical protein
MTKTALALWTAFLAIVLSTAFLGISGLEGEMAAELDDLWTAKDDHKAGIILLSSPNIRASFEGQTYKAVFWKRIHAGFPFRYFYVDREVIYIRVAKLDLFRASLNCAVAVALSGLIMAPFWLHWRRRTAEAIASDHAPHSEGLVVGQNRGTISKAIHVVLLGSTVLYLIGWTLVLPWIWDFPETDIRDITDFGFDSLNALALVLATFSCVILLKCNWKLALLGWFMAFLCLVMEFFIAGAGII